MKTEERWAERHEITSTVKLQFDTEELRYFFWIKRSHEEEMLIIEVGKDGVEDDATDGLEDDDTDGLEDEEDLTGVDDARKKFTRLCIFLY